MGKNKEQTLRGYVLGKSIILLSAPPRKHAQLKKLFQANSDISFDVEILNETNGNIETCIDDAVTLTG